MKKIALAALLSAFVAAPAVAADQGAYVAFDYGSASFANATIPASGGYPAATFPNPGMMNIAVGYHFTPMIAAEVGYSTFGDSVIDYVGLGTVTLATSALKVAAVGTYPLSTQFDLFAKLGMSSNSGKLTGSGLLSGANTTTSKTDMLFGVGAQYNINKQISIRAQYESLGAIESGANGITVSAVSVGVAYNF